MELILAILAGAVQGLTEFLPVSSTGHLIIFEKFFSLNPQQFGLAFDASLHLGTLLAILVFFHKEYLQIFKNNLLAKLAIGTLPAAAIGFFLEDYIDTVFRQTEIVAVALIVFSFVIIAAEKYGKKQKTQQEATVKDALLIGFFQALALIPGISRSGSTISAGLFLGLKRDEAAKFAFLLSGPIIAGAGSKKFLDVILENGLQSSSFSIVLIGIISSAFFGYITIKYFLKYLSQKTLFPFVVYRIVLGAALLIFSLI